MGFGEHNECFQRLFPMFSDIAGKRGFVQPGTETQEEPAPEKRLRFLC